MAGDESDWPPVSEMPCSMISIRRRRSQRCTRYTTPALLEIWFLHCTHWVFRNLASRETVKRRYGPRRTFEGCSCCARKAKNFSEADRIRDELDAMGVVVKDSKDPKTGELVTRGR